MGKRGRKVCLCLESVFVSRRRGGKVCVCVCVCVFVSRTIDGKVSLSIGSVFII